MVARSLPTQFAELRGRGCGFEPRLRLVKELF